MISRAIETMEVRKARREGGGMGLEERGERFTML